MENKKRDYGVYFLNLLASGLFYSFITSKILSLNIQNSLLVVAVSSTASILVLLDVRNSNFLEKIPVRLFPMAGLVISVALFFLSHYFSNIYVYLVSYFLMEIIITVLLLIFQTGILKYEMNFTIGFLNMQLLRTLSTLLGFFIGVTLAQIQMENIFYLTFIVVVLLNLVGTYNYTEKIAKIAKPKVHVQRKYYYFIMGFFSTATILWIPLLTKSFIESNLVGLSWLPFVSPGIMSILFITLQKKKFWFYNSLFMETAYIVSFLCFSLVRGMNGNVFVQTILFSIITAIDLSLSIRIRKKLLEINQSSNMKYILQTISVSSSMIALAFSLFGSWDYIVENVLTALCVLSALYMIINKKEFV
jgi:hypothetical protein